MVGRQVDIYVHDSGRPLVSLLARQHINLKNKKTMSKMTGEGWKTILKIIAAIATALLGAIGAAHAMG